MKKTTMLVPAAALVGLWPTSLMAQSKGAKIGAERLVRRWVRPDGGNVVEIRSVQADGTLDALRFVPDKDRLIGAYYQAVQKQTFDVEFARPQQRRYP